MVEVVNPFLGKSIVDSACRECAIDWISLFSTGELWRGVDQVIPVGMVHKAYVLLGRNPLIVLHSTDLCSKAGCGWAG